MRKFGIIAAICGAMSASGAYAQDCTSTETDPFEIDGAGVTALYDCIKDALVEGYSAGDNPIASVYRDWAATATRPGVAGPHGNRFLMTFANDVAAEQYLKYEDEGVVMPVGSVLAKESFKISKKGKVRRGPLFIMTKVAAGEADEFDNWVYSAVQPKGKAMKIKQKFCHDCHVAYEDQDNLGYPVEEVRISN